MQGAHCVQEALCCIVYVVYGRCMSLDKGHSAEGHQCMGVPSRINLNRRIHAAYVNGQMTANCRQPARSTCNLEINSQANECRAHKTLSYRIESSGIKQSIREDMRKLDSGPLRGRADVKKLDSKPLRSREDLRKLDSKSLRGREDSRKLSFEATWLEKARGNLTRGHFEVEST